MKKTALTFGLFSLVMVATSFAAPTTSFSEPDTIVGQSTGRDGGRKVDFHSTTNDLKNNQSEAFSQDRQSLRNTIKLD